MDPARVALVVIAAAFAASEIVRPTTVHPKLIASRALLVASQNAASARPDTLDAELLDDLPRIWPNAPARLRVHTAGERRVLAGRIDDPYTGGPGAAVFPIVAGKRLVHFRASYVGSRYTLEYACAVRHTPARSSTEIAVGMIAADQRGYFHSAATTKARPCGS